MKRRLVQVPGTVMSPNRVLELVLDIEQPNPVELHCLFGPSAIFIAIKWFLVITLRRAPGPSPI